MRFRIKEFCTPYLKLQATEFWKANKQLQNPLTTGHIGNGLHVLWPDHATKKALSTNKHQPKLWGWQNRIFHTMPTLNLRAPEFFKANRHLQFLQQQAILETDDMFCGLIMHPKRLCLVTSTHQILGLTKFSTQYWTSVNQKLWKLTSTVKQATLETDDIFCDMIKRTKRLHKVHGASSLYFPPHKQ